MELYLQKNHTCKLGFHSSQVKSHCWWLSKIVFGSSLLRERHPFWCGLGPRITHQWSIHPEVCIASASPWVAVTWGPRQIHRVDLGTCYTSNDFRGLEKNTHHFVIFVSCFAGEKRSAISHTMCPLGPGTEAASSDVGMDPEGRFPAARGWELGEFWNLNNNDVTQTSLKHDDWSERSLICDSMWSQVAQLSQVVVSNMIFHPNMISIRSQLLDQIPSLIPTSCDPWNPKINIVCYPNMLFAAICQLYILFQLW